MNGICRWCYELTASPTTRWHLYCLNAYRVASGQHPDEIQYTLCEICGDPSDEMDHRLAIEVARALGPAATLRAFTLDNLRWLCPELPQAQDTAGLAACEVSVGMLAGLVRRSASAQAEPKWVVAFLLPCSLEPSPRQTSAG